MSRNWCNVRAVIKSSVELITLALWAELGCQTRIPREGY